MAENDITLLVPSFFRTLFLVAIATASLVVVDGVLANTEKRETALEAVRFYRDGESLMQQGKYSQAAEAFRSAIANARGNAEYPLALGEALLDAGQLDQAEETLGDLLRADSMAGAPNLAMARVYAKEGQDQEATFFYHRAIYGQWKLNATASQIKVRFELADLLARRNVKGELLAELLPLQAQAPTDPATQAKLAGLYMMAGSPARAASIFHDLVSAHPEDPDAREGLGNAYLAVGNYTAAQSAFIATLHLRPDDKNARTSLELCDQVLKLDPMRRGLDGQERLQRSVNVLQLVTDKAAQCMSPAQAQAQAELINAAHAALKSRVRPGAQSVAVEANLDLANKLWQAAKADCKPALSAADQPLQLVLAKSAQ